MKKAQTVRQAAEFGRVRLSRTFFMRDFLYSEISAIHGIPNFPDDPDAAIASMQPRGYLTRPGFENHDGDHSSEYPDFPTLVTTTRLTPAPTPVQPRITGLE